MARKFIELKAGCMAKAFDNEPTFVLLARDSAAPWAIRAWVSERIRLGLNKRLDNQIIEALEWADLMDKEREGWRTEITRIWMEKEGITQQDIAETMPPKHPEFR